MRTRIKFVDEFKPVTIEFRELSRIIPHLHATDLISYLDCRRKFFFSKIERLSPLEDKEFFEIGKSGHLVLRSFYKREDWQQVLTEIKNEEHRCHLSALIKGYEKEYADDFEKYQIAAVEDEISITFEGLTITFTIDVLALESGAGYNIIDHKFYASFPNEKTMWNDFQATFYLWACRKLGLNVKKYILNVIKKEPMMMPTPLKNGTLSKSKAQMNDTEYDMYFEAIQLLNLNPADYAAELQYLKNRGSGTYKRYVTKRTDFQLDMFEQDLSVILKEIHDQNTRFYPNPSRHCLSCDFNFLCQTMSSGGDYPYTKKSMYRQKSDDER